MELPPKNVQLQNRTELDVWSARDHFRRFVRGFFHDRDYVEIDTPILVMSPGTEVHLNYFDTRWTDHSGKVHQQFLRSSPELHLKQALARGFKKVFHIAPCFRNKGEHSKWHHPEFSMLEWYETGLDYDAIIGQTESFIFAAAKSLAEYFAEHNLAFKHPVLPVRFPRYKIKDAFRDFSNIDLIDEDPDLATKARKAGCQSVLAEDDFETAFFKVLLDKIEPAIAAAGGAVLTDYPPSQAALAIIKCGVAKRFEFYLPSPEGSSEVIELCNGFEELLGEKENRLRIQKAAELRAVAGNPPVPEDPDFYAAMSRGLPPCSGNALGFDRLFGFLLGEVSLDAVIPFRGAAAWKRD